MPRYDGTGPWGMGPGTGWGMGPCGAGAGMGWRRGYGRFMRKWGGPFWAMTGTEEKDMLQDELKALEEEMADVKKRLEDLKGEKSSYAKASEDK